MPSSPVPQGITRLDPATESAGSSSSLDLGGGGYDPFSLDAAFGGSKFDISRTSTVKRRPIVSPEPGFNPSINVTEGETRRVQQFFEGIAADPATLKGLQLALIGAGFNLDATGSLDATTQNALSALIQEAQRDNRSLLDVISAHAKAQKSPEAKARSLAALAESEFQQQLIASYIRWWGVPPTEGWVKSALASGQNLFEIEFGEKSKPAYRNSPTYQTNRNAIENQLSGGELSTQTFSGAGNSFSPGPVG